MLMTTTRSDIPDLQRKAMVGLLNERLADCINLGLHAKSAHWNVRGPNFIALHKLFDEVYEAVEQHTDEIAERLAALGGMAEGDLASIQSHSVLGDHPLQASETEHIAALADALATFSGQMRAAFMSAEEAGDPATSDLCTEIIRSIDKHRWFVESHLNEGESHDRWK